MTKRLLQLTILLLVSLNLMAQDQIPEIMPPVQPPSGPGSATYVNGSMTILNRADKVDGYWLFEPATPVPDSANVIVFLHGHSRHNPVIYGQWIRHLVQQGNIVIFPRFQTTRFKPGPGKFIQYSVKGIKDALVELQKPGHVKPILRNITYTGHSYGGALAANMAVNYQKYGIPKPAALFLSEPGTGPLPWAKLKSYENIPPDVKIIIVVGNDDQTVGDVLGIRIFQTAIHTPERNLVRTFYDNHGDPGLRASHHEPYSVDLTFADQIHPFFAEYGYYKSKLDAIDYYCYWKLMDALLDYTRTGKNKEYAFGNTPQQRCMGFWSDGTPVREMQVTVPEVLNPTLAGMKSGGSSKGK